MTTLLEENDFKVLRKTLKDLIRNLSFDLLTMKFHDDCLMMVGEYFNSLVVKGNKVMKLFMTLSTNHCYKKCYNIALCCCYSIPVTIVYSCISL